MLPIAKRLDDTQLILICGRNAALANYMTSFGNLDQSPELALGVYFHHCAIAMNCRQLALAGRFLAFVRTLLPTMAGISGLSNRRFQFFNWLSALLWVCVVTGLGYALSMIPFVKRHEDQVMTCLMILPIALLLAGLLGTLFVVIKKKYCSA